METSDGNFHHTPAQSNSSFPLISWNQYRANTWAVLFYFLFPPSLFQKYALAFTTTIFAIFISQWSENKQIGQEWAHKRSVAKKEIQYKCPRLLPNSLWLRLCISKGWIGAVDLVQGQIRQEIALSPTSLLFGSSREAVEEQGCCLSPSLIYFLPASQTTRCTVVYYYYHCYFPECCKTRG